MLFKNTLPISDVVKNLMVGIVLSLVMLNLAIAMGILSGRGVFAGAISAAIIAIITSAFGGTKVQGSGPTAPMGALTAVILAFAYERFDGSVIGITADQFVNVVIFLSAIFLVIFGRLRLGRLIDYIPKLVISGFMCGISLIIWDLQFDLLFGLGRPALEGPMSLNVGIAIAAFLITWYAPLFIRSLPQGLLRNLPAALIALVLITCIVQLFRVPVETLAFDNPISSYESFKTYIAGQIPSHINMSILMMALPHAIKLALLCVIDTLLTSLVVDRMRGTKTKRSQELYAQGGSMALVSLFGGVPGAQSTVPAILNIKEGGSMRLAGVSAGILIVLQIFLLGPFLSYIPTAVFAGILIKVGYDVFDIKPILAYMRTLRRHWQNRQTYILRHREMTVVMGTALTTLFVDIIVAVAIFSLGQMFVNRWGFKSFGSIRDIVPS